MDLIHNEDYAADNCAISPTAFLLQTLVGTRPLDGESDFIVLSGVRMMPTCVCMVPTFSD